MYLYVVGVGVGVGAVGDVAYLSEKMWVAVLEDERIGALRERCNDLAICLKVPRTNPLHLIYTSNAGARIHLETIFCADDYVYWRGGNRSDLPDYLELLSSMSEWRGF